MFSNNMRTRGAEGQNHNRKKRWKSKIGENENQTYHSENKRKDSNPTDVPELLTYLVQTETKGKASQMTH
jgi:hypothetical protein